MKKNKKLVALSIVACALSLTGAMLCVSSPITVGATSEGLTMTPGASVRLKTSEDAVDAQVNGLRFEAQMTKAYYDALTGSEVVLKSTATAKNSNGTDLSKTVEWTIKSANPEAKVLTFSDDGVAKFHHTITFDSLFGAENAEKLKIANAMEFTANFSLDSNVDTEDWNSGTQTRSMRQVAYMAYTTPGTETEPNAGYQNETLLNYFTQGNAKETYVQKTGDTAIVTDGKSKAYIGTEDVTTKTATELFEGETIGATKTAIVFDENNVASETTVHYVTEKTSRELWVSTNDITASKYNSATKNAAADTYHWGDGGDTATLPTGVTQAFINGEEVTVSDSKMPQIKMDYVRTYTNYGRDKTTKMVLSVGDKTFEKGETESISLRLITENDIYIYDNVMVATKVLLTATDLNLFDTQDTGAGWWKNGYYVLGRNIDASGTTLSHVSASYNHIHKAFMGTFDGRGYTISNLKANVESATTKTISGIFGLLYGATIRNVAFVDVNIEGQSLFGYSQPYFSTTVSNNTVTDGAFTSDPSMFPYVKNPYAYANNVIDNVYIKVAEGVTNVAGVLFEGGLEMAQARITNVLVEWTPTDVAATGKFSGVTLDNRNKTYSNIVVISPAIDIGTYTFVTKYTASSAAADVAFTAFNSKYWTIPTKGVPTWNTAVNG